MNMPFLNRRATAVATPISQVDRLRKIQSLVSDESHRRRVEDAVIRGLIEDAIDLLESGRARKALTALKIALWRTS